MTDTIQGRDFQIVNITPQLATIYPKNQNAPFTGFDGNYLVLDFGEKKVGDLTECNLLFVSEKYRIMSTGATCGCTVPSFRDTEDKNKQHVTVKFDSSKITKNVSKSFWFYFENGTKIDFNLVINK